MRIDNPGMPFSGNIICSVITTVEACDFRGRSVSFELMRRGHVINRYRRGVSPVAGKSTGEQI